MFEQHKLPLGPSVRLLQTRLPSTHVGNRLRRAADVLLVGCRSVDVQHAMQVCLHHIFILRNGRELHVGRRKPLLQGLVPARSDNCIMHSQRGMRVVREQLRSALQSVQRCELLCKRQGPLRRLLGWFHG